jgi:hypothetical protein
MSTEEDYMHEGGEGKDDIQARSHWAAVSYRYIVGGPFMASKRRIHPRLEPSRSSSMAQHNMKERSVMKQCLGLSWAKRQLSVEKFVVR